MFSLSFGISLVRRELGDGVDLLDERAAAEQVRRLLPDLGGKDVPRVERVVVECRPPRDVVPRAPERVGHLDVAVRKPRLEGGLAGHRRDSRKRGGVESPNYGRMRPPEPTRGGRQCPMRLSIPPASREPSSPGSAAGSG